ncbi:hypothetical protein Taro_026517, partial [Colocasia esculenta]|nr:hypothetical protein [Colocasia esculenta]
MPRLGCRWLKALAGHPFSLSPSFPSLLPLQWCSTSLSPLCAFLVRRRVVLVSLALWSLRGARRRWPIRCEGPPMGSVLRLRWSIPWVCLCRCRDRSARRDTRRSVFPVGCDLVMTRCPIAIRIAIATRFPVATWFAVAMLSRRDRVAVAVPFPVAMHVGVCLTVGFALRTFRWGMRQVASPRSVTEGDTFVAVSWRRCQEAHRLSPLLRTPILGSLLMECSELRACSSFALRTFRWGMRQVASPRSVTEGDTFVAVSWRRCQEAHRLSPLLRSPILGSLLMECSELRACSTLSHSSEEVRGRSQDGEQREWLVCPPLGCQWRLHGGYSLVVPSFLRGGTSVCGFPNSRYVWGPRWLCLWALDLVEVGGGRACGGTSFSPSCYMVSAGAHSPYFLQLGAHRRGGLVSDGLQRQLWHRVLSAVVRASVEGCSFCYVACVASVVARCVWAVVAQLAVDSLAVVFPVWRTIRCNTCLWLFVGLVLAGCELWCIAWLPCVLWRFSQDQLALLLLAIVFFLMVRVVWLFGLCVLVKALPRISLCHFWQRFFPGVFCICFGPPLCCPCGSKCPVWLGCVLVRFSQDVSWHFWWRFSPKLLRNVLIIVALSLFRDELLLLPVGLSVLQSAWAFLVKVLCPWLCVWLLHWPPCLVVCFQVVSVVPVGLCVSPWLGWFVLFFAPDVLLQMVICPIGGRRVVLDLCGCFGSSVVVRLFGGWHVGTRAELRVRVVGFAGDIVGCWLVGPNSGVRWWLQWCGSRLAFSTVRRRAVLVSLALWSLCGARRRWRIQHEGPPMGSALRLRRGVCSIGRDLVTMRCPVAIRIAIATHFSVATWFTVATLSHRDRVAIAVPFPVVMVASLCSVTEGDTFVAVSWRRCQEALVCACLVLSGLVVGYKPAIQRGFCCACSACSPGAWHLRAGPVLRLSPLPGTPILGSLLRECSGLQACSILFLARPRQSFVSLPLSALIPEPRSGVRRGAAAWPGYGVACILVGFCGGFVSLFWGVIAWTCLVSIGIVSLALLANASGGFRFGVLSVPVPVALAARGLSSRELGVGWVVEAAVAACAVSSSESECCELLYLSELRVVLCKFSGSVGGDANFEVPSGGGGFGR